MPEVKKVAKVANAAKAEKPEVKAEKKERVKVDMECKYASTGKYNPKATHNIKSMQEVEAVLPATYKEIQAAIPQHTDFIGYLIRRGGLAPQ